MNKIIIISGSNNKNLEVSKEFEKSFQKKGVQSEILDLVSLNLPLYSPVAETRGIPEVIGSLKEKVDNSKGLVFVSPEYNGGIPPVVTNFIAWISRSGDKNWRDAFNGKVAALASFSGSGGIQMLISLRTQLSYIGLNVLGRQVRATYQKELDLKDIDTVSEQLLKWV